MRCEVDEDKRLEQSFINIYNGFRMGLYSRAFNQGIEVDSPLSSIEVICVEVIYALNHPTINEFATFCQFSAPNAAYKVNSLVRKGYIRRVRSLVDKREYHLEVTEKYMKTYGVTYDYIPKVMKRIRGRFSSEEVAEFERMLSIIDRELMGE